MKIYMTVKSLGKKQNYLTKKEVILNETPGSLRELICQLVTQNVQEYNEKQAQTPLVHFLTTSDIELQRSSGKVGFRAKYNENEASVEEAVSTAIQAFEDGLFRVYVREEEAEKLDEPLKMEEGDEVVFIRFIMLAGRMW